MISVYAQCYILGFISAAALAYSWDAARFVVRAMRRARGVRDRRSS